MLIMMERESSGIKWSSLSADPVRRFSRCLYVTNTMDPMIPGILTHRDDDALCGCWFTTSSLFRDNLQFYMMTAGFAQIVFLREIIKQRDF